MPLKGGRCSFLDSVRKAEIGEKFQARLIFAFQDLEGSLEELGELLEGALQILEPFRKEMESVAGEKRAYWQSYFAKHTMEDFFALTGIYVDEKNYSQLLLRWELVNGIHMSLKMDEDQEADTLEILVGSLMNEEVIREWKKGGREGGIGADGGSGEDGHSSVCQSDPSFWPRGGGTFRTDHSDHLLSYAGIGK